MKSRIVANVLGLCAVIALITACSTTSSTLSADEKALARGARAALGGSLVGTLGATPKDQNNIDETMAGGCATGIYTQSECARHERETKR